MHPIEAKLQEIGIVLPEIAAPAANYVPVMQAGKLLVVSGQLPMEAGKMAYSGQVTSVEEGQKAAALCAVNILAQLKSFLAGDWQKLEKLVRLGVFVNAPAGFTEAHLVANGASDFLVEVLGDAGKHARAAVCVSELPLGAMVEVEAMALLKQ